MYRYRRSIWIFVAIILLVSLGFNSYEEYVNSIKAKEISVYVDKSFEEDFKYMTDNEQVVLEYEFTPSDDFKNSNIILTSDFSKINSEKEYKTLNYSPLIFAMKNSSDLNNFRVANTKQGWLITPSKINNDENDLITCDFEKVFEVVISGGDWSDLGGADERIKIYCPSLETIDGQLFKEFLIRILNNGSKESNKEIESKIKKFFSSPNVIQEDVISKLKKMQNNIPSDELYVALETDFLDYIYEFEKNDNELNLSFIYPEICVVREIYLQYNEVEETLQEVLSEKHFHFAELEGHYGFENYFYFTNGYAYRNKETNLYCSLDSHEKYNFQEGINTFDMKYN